MPRKPIDNIVRKRALRLAKQNKSHFFCFGQPERLEFEKFFD